jgi:hypothetical protein
MEDLRDVDRDRGSVPEPSGGDRPQDIGFVRPALSYSEQRFVEVDEALTKAEAFIVDSDPVRAIGETIKAFRLMTNELRRLRFGAWKTFDET